MSVKVEKSLFDELWTACGTIYLPINEETKDFLHEQMEAVNDQFLDVACVPNLAPVTTVDMNSWQSVIKWLNTSNAHIYFDWLDVEEQTLSPQEYFGSRDKLLADVLDAATEQNFSGCSVWAVEIECNGRTLQLIYNDVECWSLGHGDSVLIVEDIAQVTDHDGFFAYTMN